MFNLQRLTLARMRRRLTSKELAEALGMSPVTVGTAHMAGDALMIMEDLDSSIGEPDVHPATDQLVRHRVKGLVDFNMIIGVHLRRFPFGVFERLAGQRRQGGALDFLEQLSAVISSGLGGYLAGRLRRKSSGLETTEVQFRDTAHGFLAWAVASIVGAVLLASPASSLIGSTAGGMVQAGASQSSPLNNYADMLLRSDNRSDQQSLADTRGEVARLLTTSFRANNDVNGTDRDYLVKTVASRTGLSQADAEKRVNDVMTQAKQDLDKARKAAIHTAIWLTLSLFIGAFAAAAAAWEGGGVRDGTWGRATIRETVARPR